MGKYKRYKNGLEMFLSSDKGKRILNFCYCWGASIVILGAMFKLLHLPYGNQILCAAMIVEAIVFFISAFERPVSDYQWEDVFPVLKSKNPLDRPDFSGSSVSEKAMDCQSQGLDVAEVNFRNIPDSSRPFNVSTAQVPQMAEMTEATQRYLDQLSAITDNMSRFRQVTDSLSDVSDTLLNSYQTITDNSEGINQYSRGYVQQMETLNRNISGLNTIYEIQLKSISSQIDSIEHINSGLNRIKDMYDNSVVDSSVFRNETEKMNRQLSELNQVYARLLQAMTVNMYGGGTPHTNNPSK